MIRRFLVLLDRIKGVLTNPSGSTIGFSIFTVEGEFPNLSGVNKKIIDINPARFRLTNKNPVQIADPFVVLVNGDKFCFFETKSQGRPGEICVLKFSDSGKFTMYRCDLQLASHASFPFLFQDKLSDKIYLMPETAAEREVAIYESVVFPTRWQKKIILLTGNYVDSHVFEHDHVYYLFTTVKIATERPNYFNYQLQLYTSNDLLGNYSPHPMNPIKTGRKFARSAGGIIVSGNTIFRVAQDCTNSYGRELTVFEILKLTPKEYVEEVVVENWINITFGHVPGGHHVSQVISDKQHYLAVDFNYTDSYFQRFINPLIK